MKKKPENRLPESVDLIRQDLLNFEEKVPESFKTKFMEMRSAEVLSTRSNVPEPPNSIYWKPATGAADPDEEKRIARQIATIRAAQKKAKIFRSYKRESEARWTSALAYVFKEYETRSLVGIEERRE